MKTYVVTFQKTKFLHYNVEADSIQEAIEIANDTDEKFGIVIEQPYFLVCAREEEAS